jgi:hypothetical protein
MLKILMATVAATALLTAPMAPASAQNHGGHDGGGSHGGGGGSGRHGGGGHGGGGWGWHGGGGWHGGHHRGGWGWGPALGLGLGLGVLGGAIAAAPYYNYYGAYGYPPYGVDYGAYNGYNPAYTPQAQTTWYWCDYPQGYYPNVQSCSTQWRTVVQ